MYFTERVLKKIKKLIAKKRSTDGISRIGHKSEISMTTLMDFGSGKITLDYDLIRRLGKAMGMKELWRPYWDRGWDDNE